MGLDIGAREIGGQTKNDNDQIKNVNIPKAVSTGEIKALDTGPRNIG